ncbi:hypothetical protein V8E55_011868, partial [Tylopilus felleus]
PQPSSLSSSIIPHVILHVWGSFTMLCNKFGITRTYHHHPTHDPDSLLSKEEMSQSQQHVDVNSPQGGHRDYSPPWTWSNMSTWHLMNWKSTGSYHKSNSEVTWLVQEVLQAQDFKIKDLSSFDAARQSSRFNAAQKEIPPDDVFGIDRWKLTSINISIPTREKKKEGNGVTFSMDGLCYRPILNIICTVFADPLSKSFHLTLTCTLINACGVRKNKYFLLI